jgi:hypothetical protein
MSHPLDGARAKVKRAMHHVQNLKRDIEAFIDQNSYIARIEKDANTSTVRIIAKASGLSEPPIDFILLAGEVAHQLRSALDHAVYALCSLRYRRPPKHLTQFPIFETAAGYKTRGRPKIKDIPRTASAYIKSVQPYHRRTAKHQHPLWMLQDLNNTDKHRLIPIAIVGAWAVHFRGTTYVKTHSLLFGPIVHPLKDGAELFVMPVPDPNLDLEVDPKLECTIAFEQIGDAKLQAVIPVLKQLCSFVDRIIYTLSLP